MHSTQRDRSKLAGVSLRDNNIVLGNWLAFDQDSTPEFTYDFEAWTFELWSPPNKHLTVGVNLRILILGLKFEFGLNLKRIVIVDRGISTDEAPTISFKSPGPVSSEVLFCSTHYLSEPAWQSSWTRECAKHGRLRPSMKRICLQKTAIVTCKEKEC